MIWEIIGIKSYIGSIDKYNNYIYGPEYIREGLKEIFYSTFYEINFENIKEGIDFDIINDENKYIDDIYTKIKNIYKKENRYVFLGGDHSITYPIIKILKENFGDFYILYFDSHPDIQPDPDINNESFIFHLIRNDIINKDKLIYLGISNFSKEEIDIIKHWKIKYYTPYDIKFDFEKILELRNILENKNVYISIDIDVFDSLCGHWKEPLNINILDYFRIIKMLKINLLSFDIVEVENNKYCGKYAAKILLETISILDNNNRKN